MVTERKNKYIYLNRGRDLFRRERLSFRVDPVSEEA